MIQRAKRLAIRCSKCGKPPLHVHVLGSDKHFIECPNCGRRTELCDALILALRAWTADETRAVPAPFRSVGP